MGAAATSEPDDVHVPIPTPTAVGGISVAGRDSARDSRRVELELESAGALADSVCSEHLTDHSAFITNWHDTRIPATQERGRWESAGVRVRGASPV